MYTITDIAPTDAEFIALIAALDAWQETLYPAESNHLLDLSQLPPQTVIALAIRSPQGEAVGCGAIVLSEEGFGEMKRVYIDPQHRGQQLGEKLLAALEAKARQRDCHTLRLETGIHQHAAIALYTRNGYHSPPGTSARSWPPRRPLRPCGFSPDRWPAQGRTETQDGSSAPRAYWRQISPSGRARCFHPPTAGWSSC